MSNGKVREATLEDLPAVIVLEQDLIRTDAPGDPYLVRTPMQQEMEEQFRKVITGDWGVCLVAEHGDQVIGYLSGGIKDSPRWRPARATEIHALFVRDGFRNVGIGAQLVDTFVRWSRERGAQVVEVGAFASNARGLQFYERMGFRPTMVHLELPL
ncbi:MAG: hypothetical protein AVDCRST_MAG77-1864 [uncultured Chloroflexi bacterium]|uniref:N-acetyltransferase domain-containing protein n=1 Tax=uncultured Chloroflexota bacterium TaxID=166587 RepID=A0A6J4I984_9CHLR|nr:MAG: hypothetical protein AVDCRST_MAG77-1864 [uncultured Chloroflexota bacterium]